MAKGHISKAIRLKVFRSLCWHSCIPYHGVTLTDKGRKTGIYYYTSLRSARIAAHCFGGSVKSFLPAGFDTRWLRKDERRTENNPAGFLAGLEKDLEEALC